MALALFDQQAAALGRLFTIAANFNDPSRLLRGRRSGGGGAALRRVVPRPGPRAHDLREEQAAVARFVLVPDRDMAGARGSALAAAATLAL